MRIKIQITMNGLISLCQPYEKEVVDSIRAILEDNDITYKVNFAKTIMETGLGTSSSQYYEIFVNKEIYPKAFELIGSIIEKTDMDFDFGTYTNEEIRDILLNPNDWHASFIYEAKKIAQERNIHINQDKLKEKGEMKLNDAIGTETNKKETYKEARKILFYIAGINIVIPIILIVPGDGIKMLNLIIYLTDAIIFSGLGLLAKRIPLIASVIGLVILLAVYYFIYMGDPTMITRYLYLKIVLVGGLVYSIYKSAIKPKSGKYYIEDDFEKIENKTSDLYGLFESANQVITEYRLITDKK